MRLFIAIQLNEDMKQALLSVQESFRAQGVRGNYTPEENLHLTLAFIGEYPAPELVLEIMEEIEFEPIRLEFDGIGSFHNLWWAGIRENEDLRLLVRRLRRALAEDGVPYDRKKFRPHITLIRKPVFRGRHGSAPAELSDLAWPAGEAGSLPQSSGGSTAAADRPAYSMTLSADMLADRISLMLSTRGKHGMIYTELGAAMADPGGAARQRTRLRKRR